MLLTVAVSACKKPIPVKPPQPTPVEKTQEAPPPPARPQAPTATLAVEPSSITPGQSAVLRWTSTNANDVSINTGIGTVAASGNRTVNPTNTTTYTLTPAVLAVRRRLQRL